MHTEEEFIVIDETTFRMAAVPPSAIKIRESGAAGMFGKHEVELAAGKLVAFFQKKGRWDKFSITELYNFYKSNNWNPDLMFFGLSGRWFDDSPIMILTGTPWVESDTFLVLGFDGYYRVTDLFIQKCLKI